MATNLNKAGKFNYEYLTVKFGGELSKPENIFIAKAIKVPTYKYKIKERECLGNGWYGGMEVNEYTNDNLYIIIKDEVCIGQMQPYSEDMNMKSQLQGLNSEAIKFLNHLKIKFD